MRKLFIVFAVFFSFTVSGQYTWKQKGIKTLVGKERKYFGTETRPEELKKIACGCEPYADYSGQEKKFLGNLSPDIGESGRGLFWNFDKQGRAHLTELQGSDEVFLKGPCPYAVACGNLLKQEELEVKSPAPEKEKVEKPEKNYNKVDEGPQNYNQNERRIIGVMPPTEFMVYICFWQKYESPSLLRYVTQQEAQVAISSSGRCSGWRVCTDADLAHFGVHKPAYQNEIVRSGYR